MPSFADAILRIRGRDHLISASIDAVRGTTVILRISGSGSVDSTVRVFQKMKQISRKIVAKILFPGYLSLEPLRN